MKPLDPRLLRHARAARSYIVLTAVSGAATAGLVVTQALLIASILGPLAEGTAALATLVGRLVAVLAVAGGRGLVAAAQERYSHRAATNVIADLRGQILTHAVALGPRWRSQDRAAGVAALTTRGLDALDAYFSKYLPQLLMVLTVTPALLIVVATMDWISAVTMLVTLPLVPIFMILIGKTTAEISARRLTAMTTLGARVLDLMSGLPTLKALGRETGPSARVRDLSEAHARTTFGTVRVAFLSGAALELVSTLSVALVAVPIAMRLVFGDMPLTVAIAILIMAPEVYFPVRAVGTHFHASANGLAAANQAFEILGTPAPTRGTQPAPDLAHSRIVIDAVSVRAPGRPAFTPAGLSVTLRPGSVTALVGPNGVGKSTAIGVLLALIPPDRGSVMAVDDAGVHDLADISPSAWWAQIAWVPQRPALLPGTVWQNLTGDFSRGSEPHGAALATANDAATRAGFAQVLASLPDGWGTAIGHGGVGLSVGQGQRLAFARALLQDRPLVVLDEPTAHLDSATSATVLATIEDLARRGRTVLVVAHQASLIATADTVVEVGHAPAPAGDAEVLA
ncbi:MAG: thiol reductant ABC exporter subunit CydD [Bifidobacteriaceae bacterium]|jgi:ATP-binding cassette subfamily C protein CydD|nr:thiol reductant ABC exporter subunit CydD [Bifidobacteriaceae bacterium]